MLLECLHGAPLTVDGSPILDNIRLNLAGNHQLRFKAIYVADGNNIPIDIVVLNYTSPKISLNSISMIVTGVERNKSSRFNLNISFNFFKKKCHINGIFLDKNIDMECDNFLEIIKIFKEVL